MTLVVVVGFLAVNGLLGLASARLAARLAEDPVEQVMLGLLLSAFWLVTASLLAAMLGIYHLPGMCCLLLPWLLGSLRWGRAPRHRLTTALLDAFIWLRSRPKLWIVAAPHLCFLFENLRAFAAPPRAWDALAYHLPRAAFWIQDQGLAGSEWPVQIEFYRYFGPAGDFLWAWTMLSGLGDGLLFLAYLVIWIGVTVSVLALSREIGLDAGQSALATAVVLSTPALLGAANSAYVDNLLLALQASMLVAFSQAVRRRSPLWLLAGLAAAGLAACTKFSAVPLLLPVLLFIAAQAWASGVALRPWFWMAAAGAALPIALWMGWTLVHTGSLTYPFALLDGRMPWLDGNAVLARKRSFGIEGLDVAERTYSSFRLLRAVVGPLGIGLWAGVLATLALLGLRDRPRIWPLSMTALALIAAALPIAGAFAPDNRAMITVWIDVLGRHLLLTLTLVVLLAGRNRGLFPVLLLCSSIIHNVLYRSRFSGMSWSEFDLLQQVLLPIFAVLLPLAVIAFLARRRLSATWLGGAMAVLTIAALVLVWMPLRDRHRQQFYALAVDRDSYEMHFGGYPAYIEAFNIVDGEIGQRVAYSPPDDRSLFYPLFGRHLQNRVELLSAASVDSVGRINPEGTPETRRSFQERLSASEFDWLVLDGSATAEISIAEQLGYQPVLKSALGTVFTYRKPARAAGS